MRACPWACEPRRQCCLVWLELTHARAVFQVVRAAEEAASTLASSIHPEQCIKVLCPIIQTADYPINLAAIKMQTKVVERIAKEALLQLLADIIPGLLQVGPEGWAGQPGGAAPASVSSGPPSAERSGRSSWQPRPVAHRRNFLFTVNMF